MTFIQRKIDLRFELGLGSFGESGTNVVTLSGHRVQAHVEKVVGPGTGQAQIRIYGMTQSLMNQLSALNQGSMAQRRNTITMLAGDDESGMAVAFRGGIQVGQQCLNTQPDVSLLIIAQGGALASVQTMPPSSYPGHADVSVILANIAAFAGWQFENNGVSMQVSTQYLWGSPMDQLRQIAKAGEGVFQWALDDGIGDAKTAQKLTIWPSGKSRQGLIPLVSSNSGMVGYPNYSTSLAGLEIQTAFNPQLNIGGSVEIKSDLQVANGVWGIFNIQHDIESETPGGAWFTRFSAASIDRINT